MAAPGAAGVARFGAFEFDRSSRELRKGGTRLRVPDQSLAILAMLLERPGELVSREAIQARLWPNGTVVEFEHSVNSAVKRLREALLDNAATPRFVETLPRKGYRFVGMLEPAVGGQPGGQPGEQPGEQPDEQPPGLTPGTILSHYRILSEAGRGAMGVVYKAEDTTLGRTVALKFLPEELDTHAPALERLRREACMIGALNHPGICTLYELGESSGRVFLAMEFLEGETLRDRMAQGSVKEGEFVEIAIQVAKALEAAHGQGMVHRDIKPDNLFLTRQGVVKLMDFGLAKAVGEEGGAAVQSLLTGTRGYMSPEQARGERLDARTDLFSFGVVLYEMATGKTPFDGKTSAALMDAILHRMPGPPSRLNPKLPPEVDRIIGKALEKDLDVRYQHASELKTDLERLKRATESGRAPYAAPAPARTVRGKLRWLVAAGTLALFTAAAVVWLARPMPPPRVTGMAQLTSDGPPKLFPVTDGARLYYYSAERRPVMIPAVGGDPVALPDPLPEMLPLDISADGSELLIREVSTVGDGIRSAGALWAAPVLGGARRRIGDLVVTWARWSPDGSYIVYTANGLHIARSDGTDSRSLVKEGPYFPRWSPDGRRIRFTTMTGFDNHRALWEISTDGRNLHALFPNWRNSCEAGAWTADGKYFVFQATSNGIDSIWALREKTGFLDRGGNEPVQLTTGPMQTIYPVPSPDGKRIFFSGYLERAELVRYDAGARQWAPYLSGIAAANLDFSRDGKWVTYTSHHEGSLWRSAVDGSQRRQLTSPPLVAGSPRWSPDGKRIAFHGGIAGTPERVFVVPAEGGAPVQVTNGEAGAAGDIDPTWSADGSLLVFSGTSHGQLPIDKILLRTVDVNTHRTSVLPGSQGLWSARWSPDGRYIAALLDEANHHPNTPTSSLVLYDLREGRQTRLVDLPDVRCDWPSWSKDGQFLYFEMGVDGGGWYRMRVRDRKLERLFGLRNLHCASQSNNWMGLTPEGSALFLRGTGNLEIYALDWEAP